MNTDQPAIVPPILKALIIDDELKARNILEHYISNFIPEIRRTPKQAESVDTALDILKTINQASFFLMWKCPIKMVSIF